MKRIIHLLTLLLFCMFIFAPVSVHAGSDVYISDTYGVLSQEEIDTLNKEAKRISDQYAFGVYAHIIYDDASYDDIWAYTEQYYAAADLGYGTSSDGILFLITQSSQSISFNLSLTCIRMPTAGVKGVCPLS